MKKKIPEKDLEELRKCRTKEALKAFFAKRGLSDDLPEKNRYLRDSTYGILENYHIISEGKTILNYETLFLDGFWRSCEKPN